MDPKSFYSSRLRRKHAQLRYIPEDSDDSELSSDEAENVDSFQADSSDSSDSEGNLFFNSAVSHILILINIFTPKFLLCLYYGCCNLRLLVTKYVF